MTTTEQISQAAEKELAEYQTLPEHITDMQEQTFRYAYLKGIELERKRSENLVKAIEKNLNESELFRGIIDPAILNLLEEYRK